MALKTQYHDEDEMDQIPTTGSKSTTTNASAPKANAKPAPASTPLAEDEVGFGDEANQEYLKSEDFLPVIQIEKNQVARFAFAPGFKLKHAKVHYLEGHGSFRCISTKDKQAVCCQKAGKPKDRFVGLVIRYQNADPKTGKFANNDTKPEIAIEAVRLSRANYRDINEAIEEGQSVYDIDLKMRHDESRSFGYRFTRIAPTPRWKMIESELPALLEPYKDGTKLASRLGKTLNSVELTGILTGASDSDDTAESVEKLKAVMDEED